MRADLHRFKAYIMMNEAESGAWRETIEDAEVKRSSSSHDRGAKRNRTSSGQAKPASSSSRRSRSASNRAQSSGGRNGGDPSSRSRASRRKSGSRS